MASPKLWALPSVPWFWISFYRAMLCIARTIGRAKLNGVNAVSFVVVKHVLENFDTFWQVK